MDEGIGIYVVEEIAKRELLPASVEIDELGTGNMNVLHAIAGREQVVFVDCAKMGEEAGTIRRFSPDEVASRKVRTSWSAHEGDLINMLDISRSIGELPGEIVLFGIEPKTIDHGEQLTPCLRARFDEYLETIVSFVANFPS